MSGSLVSVIIPAYNHEKYVQDTIKSIISQTYQNIELIIVDDGSKDKTWQKIQELKEECEKRFVRIHFETKANEGTCKTLNRLIDLAHGEYIYIIASDDLAKPDAIKFEVEFLSQNSQYALCVGDNEIIDSDNNVCYWDKNRNIVYKQDKAEYLTYGKYLEKVSNVKLLSDDFGKYHKLIFSFHIPNGYLIRKNIFELTGKFITEAPLEDYWIMLQISKYALMKYIDKVLFSYRWHNSNTVKNWEKIKKYTKNSQDTEYKLLNNVKYNEMLPYMKKIFDEGILYKKQGIPSIIELCTYNWRGYKIKRIKLFGIKIFEYKKDKV